MPRRRTPANDPTNNRERALHVAADLLTRLGYLGLTMDAIAREIGVTKPSLYYHFPGGKEYLFMALARRYLVTDQREIEQAIASVRTAPEQVKAVMRWAFSRKWQSARQLRDAVRFLPEHHQQEAAELFRTHMFNPLHQVLQNGLERGELRPHDTWRATWVLLSLMSELVGVWPAELADQGSTMPSTSHLELTADALTDLFLKGVQ